MTHVLSVGVESDPAKKLRQEWAASLAEHMASWLNLETGTRGMTRKQLQRALEDRGIEVSLQAIGYWLNAATSPRAHLQAEIAAVFSVPVRRLFPIEQAA